MREFGGGLTGAGDAEFRSWLRDDTEEYFINFRNDGNVMLHRRRCPHMVFGPGDTSNLVAARKWTSPDRRELEDRARREDLVLEYCYHCDLAGSMALESSSLESSSGADAPQEKADVLARICALLLEGNRSKAAAVARTEYPFDGRLAISRRYNRLHAMRIFVRDGFLDRYTGNKLVFPGALLLLSRMLPEEFPTHPNWKMSATHFAYWELWPTIDHVVPVTRGGLDEASNWVCTSMIRNAAKGHWKLEELQWPLRSGGDYRDWDGLTAWSLEVLTREPTHLEDKGISAWRKAAYLALRS